MKLSVLALDYDGTVAHADALDPAVRDAIAAARTRGIVVLLVTGRILDELRRVAGDLHFVDGVVAENGAVIHFPTSGRTSALAPSVPDTLLTELRRRAIPVAAGQCLVDADANDAPRLLEVIRRLELPLVLMFNRGRVMISPQGVSKATGLQVMLETLRLSARNTVAIGDAENDHELLRLAEVGVAVEWGSGALRASSRRRARWRRSARGGRLPQNVRRHWQPADRRARTAPSAPWASGRRARVLARGPRPQRAGDRRREIGQVVGGGVCSASN